MNRLRRPVPDAAAARPGAPATGAQPCRADLDEDDGAAPVSPGDDHEVRRASVPEAFHGERLDKFLVQMAGEFSRSHLQQLIERDCVTVDGQGALSASKRLKAGQAVSVTLEPTAQSSAYRPEVMPLSIKHEDADILVIDKPAGLVVHPAAGHWSGTLLNGLLAHDPAAASLARAGIVHRLDKDTSGLMVVARTLEAQTALVRAIAAREVRREYLALVWGDLGAAPFSVDAPIGRDPVSRVRMAVVASGKAARTDVWPLAVTTLDGLGARQESVTLVRCRLHSGRTHQIRVHLLSRGHPLVADALYGGRPTLGMVRQALHARSLGLTHPRSGQWLQFHAPLPEDFAAALATFGLSSDLVDTMVQNETAPLP